MPLSYVEITGDRWLALVAPRTPKGQGLPMLFWQDPNSRNQIRSQLLSPADAAPATHAWASRRCLAKRVDHRSAAHR
ncbi:MAG: hypothetical protein R2911_06660 [Caldilineaceae bacterium]